MLDQIATTFRMHETTIAPEKILILNTIPLTATRFVAETDRSIFSFLRYKSDFLKSQFPQNLAWQIYKSEIVDPILVELLAIREESPTVIDYDVQFGNFMEAVLSDQFDVIFLIAHHNMERNTIEFAAKEVRYSDVLNFLKKKLKNTHLNINFIICGSSGFSDLKTLAQRYAGMVGLGFWTFPVLESYRFIRQWVLSFDGSRTIDEAYVWAIDAFKKNIDNAK